MPTHSTIGRRAALGLLALACACAQPEKRAQLSAAETLAREGKPGAPAGARTPASEALTRGRQAEADGRWDEAQAAYSEALLRDPSSIEAAVSQARVLHVVGLHAEATLVLHSAIEAHPDSVELLAAAGDSVLAMNRPSMACEYYSMALGLRPDDAALRAEYAWALHLQGRHESVIETLRSVDQSQLPDYVRLALGRSALLCGKAELAEANLEAWVRVEPDDVPARLDLARARYLAGEDGLVLQSLEAVIARQPRSAEAFALLGHLRQRAGQQELALASYEQAVRFGADPATLQPLIDRARRALDLMKGRDVPR
ncbi:MAG TPA: tetratricopeptide repeat protein [Planctomycetota bacterium]|nr:tetratricopeptide repeat protein [Planctomycetota bacterium]